MPGEGTAAVWPPPPTGQAAPPPLSPSRQTLTTSREMDVFWGLLAGGVFTLVAGFAGLCGGALLCRFLHLPDVFNFATVLLAGVLVASASRSGLRRYRVWCRAYVLACGVATLYNLWLLHVVIHMD